MPLSSDQVVRLGGFELNALHLTGVTPEVLEGSRIASAGTPVHDVNGDVLFHRVPLVRSRHRIGFVDIAVQESLGEPLLALTTGIAWEEKAILAEATATAHAVRPGLAFDTVRFVAFSFPKVAVQFLQGDREVLMLEWRTWAEVPPAEARGRKPMEPSNFERWSLLDELPEATKKVNLRDFAARIEGWDAPALRRLNPTVIERSVLDRSGILLRLVDTRDLRYAPRPDDHHPCFELRGQQTSVWCVAASVEMLLNFYRYQYDQVRLADELDLGTCDHPNGLPYARVGDVVSVIEQLTSNTLDATLHVAPGWAVFRDAIVGGRPLISIVPGHARAVAGYTHHLFTRPATLGFKGLLVYDPWPPTDCAHPEAGGVITRWENFATQTYQYAYTAVLKHL